MTKSEFWKVFQKSSAAKRDCKLSSNDPNSIIPKKFVTDPLTACKGEPTIPYQSLQKLQVETGTPEASTTAQDVGAPTTAAPDSAAADAAPATSVAPADPVTPVDPNAAAAADSEPPAAAADTPASESPATESVAMTTMLPLTVSTSGTPTTTRRRFVESSASKLDRVTADMTEEEKADMLRIWRKMYYNKKIPCPGNMPAYLRESVPYAQTQANELRTAFIKEKYRSDYASLEMLKKKVNDAKAKKQEPGKDNRASTLRYKFRNREPIFTTYFEHHFQRYHKPPFTLKALEDCKILKYMTEKKKSDSSADSGSTESTTPSPPPTETVTEQSSGNIQEEPQPQAEGPRTEAEVTQPPAEAAQLQQEQIKAASEAPLTPVPA